MTTALQNREKNLKIMWRSKNSGHRTSELEPGVFFPDISAWYVSINLPPLVKDQNICGWGLYISLQSIIPQLRQVFAKSEGLIFLALFIKSFINPYEHVFLSKIIWFPSREELRSGLLLKTMWETEARSGMAGGIENIVERDQETKRCPP